MVQDNKELISANAKGEKYTLRLGAVAIATDYFNLIDTTVEELDKNMYLKSANKDLSYFEKKLFSSDTQQEHLLQVRHTFLRQETLLYELLAEELGEVGAWILVAHLILENEKNEKLLLLEIARDDLFNYYDIKQVENRSEFREISPFDIKNRLDDFVYLCWMMFHFHQIGRPVVDVKLQNIVKKDETEQEYNPENLHRNLAFIDFNFHGSLLQKAESRYSLRVTSKYAPQDIYNDNGYDFSNASLDVYGMVAVLYEMITGVVFSETLSDASHNPTTDALSTDLHYTSGLKKYFDTLTVDEIKSRPESIDALAAFFSTYFNQHVFRMIDSLVAPQNELPQELDIAQIACQVTDIFGVDIVQDQDSNIPWHIPWSEVQLEELTRVEAAFQVDKKNQEKSRISFSVSSDQETYSEHVLYVLLSIGTLTAMAFIWYLLSQPA